MMDKTIRAITSKDKPSLMIFNIFGWYIGAGVYDPKVDNPDTYNPEEDIMHLMGFDSMDEYRNAYPGLCLSNSALCLTSKWGSVFDKYRNSKKPPEIAKWMLVRYAPIPDCSPCDITYTIYGELSDKPTDHMLWIVQPKMSQVFKIPGFDYSNKKWPWFCEDWKE